MLMKIGFTAAMLLLAALMVFSMSACKNTQIVPPLLMFSTGIGLLVGYYVGKG
jgi:hypothetical protein